MTEWIFISLVAVVTFCWIIAWLLIVTIAQGYKTLEEWSRGYKTLELEYIVELGQDTEI
ncbi:hypothetical protein LCGC14_2368980 [marine sediment metagenome]|uniref:Uncharacterized protein n=1 Tax=marine sediment metagenome TaxID=412755 RepID=A0A0F9EGU3_9ZZZZ